MKITLNHWQWWLLLAILFSATVGLNAQDLPLRGYLSAHDPSTMIRCKDRYYQFWTGQGILSKSSADKVFWKPGPAIFTNAPAWTSNAVPGFTGLFWAPDILFFNNQYYLYYAVSTFGSQVSGIGLVTNPTLDPTDPAYKWMDQGPVITSTNGSDFNTIDPSFSWDSSGNLWMAFGSYWNGIYLVQLSTTTGLRIASNSPTYHLAYNSSIEASYLWRRGGYYYLFVNWGSCCSGVNSTYNIRVGRSTSITGPYLDQNGIDMVNNGGTLFMRANGKYSGPGHVGILSENGSQSFSYHYYDGNAYSTAYSAYGAADFSFVPLSWTTNDWPVYFDDWSAAYNFQADARDDNGQYYGLLENGAAVQPDAVHGHVLNLNGTNQYVWLPPGVAYGQTFIAVVNWRGGSQWQRIFDFGFDTTRTFLLTPASGDNVLRCDLNPGGNLQTIQWTKPLPTNIWTQVALTLDGTRAIMYLNGAPVVTNASMNLLPMNVLPQTNSLGRSKFTNDPYFNGQYTSFRVYGRVLTPTEIAAPVPFISQPANGSTYSPGDIINFSGRATDLAAVPLAATQFTWQINYSQDGQTNVVFGPISGITNGTFAIPTNATGGGNYTILLTAKDSLNRSTTVSNTLSPAHPLPDWSSYYPLRGDANDANGHFNGTLNGGASFVGDITRGTVLNLSGSGQYVSLPPGAAGMQTFMAWVKWNGGSAWQRIYDFGTGTNHYSVLTPLASSGKLRFNISVNGQAGEQIADAPSPFASNVWTHVAVVMNGQSVVLYTNGFPVVTNLFANLVTANLGATNNYLGKSEFAADPYFSGRLSSIRLFSRALSPNEITAPQITISQPTYGSIYHPGDTITFAGSANDFNDTAIATSGLTWTVKLITSTATNLVYGPTSGIATGAFNIPASGLGATNGYYQISLLATDTSSRVATNSVNIYPAGNFTGSASYYPFTVGAQDASNVFNGTLVNGASIISDLARGKVLNLVSSSSQYVNLPAGAGAAETISGWVKWGGGGQWQRVFDFGNNTDQFFYLTTADGNSLPQCAITGDNATYNQNWESPTPFPINAWTHIAVVLDGREGILYIDGQAVAVNDSVNLLLSDLAPTNNNFGKSQFATDATFNGRMSAMRLNSAALSLSQIISPTAAITQPVAGSLFAGGVNLSYAGAATDYSGTALPAADYTWSGEFHSNGATYAAFGLVTNSTSGNYLVPTNEGSSTNIFYRFNLAVTDTNGNQSFASTDVLPEIALLNFATIPTGLQIGFDGQLLSAPSSFAAVVGMDHTLSAPSPQMESASSYNFQFWSDAGATTHDISVPATNTTYLASFLQPTITASISGANLGLSWPDWAASLKLYTATNLVPPVTWTIWPAVSAPSNGVVNVLLAPTNSAQFYRLQSQ